MSLINTDELGCILVAKNIFSKINNEAHYETQQTKYPHR